jgi:hypothetical protein
VGEILGIGYSSCMIFVMIILPILFREISEILKDALNLVIIIGIMWGISLILVLIVVIVYQEESEPS